MTETKIISIPNDRIIWIKTNEFNEIIGINFHQGQEPIENYYKNSSKLYNFINGYIDLKTSNNVDDLTIINELMWLYVDYLLINGDEFFKRVSINNNFYDVSARFLSEVENYEPEMKRKLILNHPLTTEAI